MQRRFHFWFYGLTPGLFGLKINSAYRCFSQPAKVSAV
ncbi:hypothetical protein CWT02_1535 [Salmonella enterica subsp. enterica serovar Cubana]|nr:hypothetical protein CWT02_1535 [Salmonella enterica subsp. enterica serovar Cubana]